ncbi:hypothetical protein Taro_005137 [Colocasia esculenta]|uniref:beta-galactosidase n=1 Tax=Colocasia esculenta TaxID=4460 RepID=A0A843TTQ1_COLES|nr:hypothetical protein [Colocasia esculenta]
MGLQVDQAIDNIFIHSYGKEEEGAIYLIRRSAPQAYRVHTQRPVFVAPPTLPPSLRSSVVDSELTRRKWKLEEMAGSCQIRPLSLSLSPLCSSSLSLSLSTLFPHFNGATGQCHGPSLPYTYTRVGRAQLRLAPSCVPHLLYWHPSVMAETTLHLAVLLWLCCLLPTAFPANVTYDRRSLIIGGQRKLILSGSIHYPRSVPAMWPGLVAAAKEGGLDTIETYVFWNGHEPSPGKYYFEDRFDLVKFVRIVQEAGMYMILRIGPFVAAEWNFGGVPAWLHYVPGTVFRSDSEPWKAHMKSFMTLIVNLMKKEKFFASQGGPIILAQASPTLFFACLRYEVTYQLGNNA